MFLDVIGKKSVECRAKRMNGYLEVCYGADIKSWTESGWSRRFGGNSIKYGGGGAGATQSGRAGFRGNPKLTGVVFNVQGNASKMTA